MQVTGTIVKKHGKEVKANNFTLERVWVKIDETSQYPQTLEVEAAGAKSNIFDSYREGQSVVIDVNLRGNEYNGKIYNKISAWRVSAGAATSSTTTTAPTGGVEYNDGMPF